MGLCDVDWLDPAALRGPDMRTAEGFRIAVRQTLHSLRIDVADAGGPGVERAHRCWMGQACEAWPGRDPAPTEAAGLVRALLREAPLFRAAGDADDCAAFWADGVAAFALALRCHAARRAPHRLSLSRDLERLPFWWSVRENLAEEPGLARPFLQMLAGEAPNWHYWASSPPDLRPPGALALTGGAV